MSKTKTTKKAAAPKATKTAKASKAAPAKKAGALKPTATKAGDNGEAKTKKVSAIDAAAQVLAGAKEPMNAKQMIEAMAAKGLWTSPGGKTPHATLYSAILREINDKGNEARFKKTERGRFAANA
jgi:hypothetical protein